MGSLRKNCLHTASYGFVIYRRLRCLYVLLVGLSVRGGIFTIGQPCMEHRQALPLFGYKIPSLAGADHQS